MKLYDNGVLIALAIVAGIVGYGEYTSEDLEELRVKAKEEYIVFKEYAQNLKTKYETHRASCRQDDEWKDSEKCTIIKKYDDDASELWSKLVDLDKKIKKGNAKVKDLRDAMEKMEALRSLAIEISGAIKDNA